MQKCRKAMSDTPPNVKVYDRPEKTSPSPIILALIALAVLALVYFGYRAMTSNNATNSSDTAPQTKTTGSIRTDIGRTDTPIWQKRLTYAI